MKIGYQTVIWGRRIEDLRLVLEQLASFGYEGVEFAQAPSELYVCDAGEEKGGRPVRDIHELVSLVQKQGLELLGFSGGTLGERMAFCGDYRPHYLYVDSWEGAEQALQKQPPFTLAIHPHVFMPIRFLKHAEKLLEDSNTPGCREYVKFLPDTAHLTIVEEDLAEVICRHKERLAAVHIKDWLPHFGQYSHRYARGFVPLGQGIVPWEQGSRLQDKGVLDILREIGYEGWVVAELDSSPYTPDSCALECAQWLRSKGLMKPTTRPSLNFGPLARRRSKPRCPCPGDIELEFLHGLTESSGKGIQAFYESVTDAFARVIPSQLVKLWIFSPEESQMYLVSARGMSSVKQLNHLRSNGGCIGKVAQEKRPIKFDLTQPPDATSFEDKEVLAALHVKEMLSIPVLNPTNAHHLRYVINIFPEPGAPGIGLDSLFHLGQHVAAFSDSVLDELCAEAAGMISYQCSQSTTRRELMESLRRLLLSKFDCEGAQIFLVNDSRNRLQEACPGVTEWTVPTEQRYYRKGDGLTGKAWSERDMIFAQAAHLDQRATPASCEKDLSPDRRECVFATMAKRRDEVLGVIRLTNKRGTPGSICSTMFNDDDAAVLDSIIQAAVPRLELLRTNERQLKALGRMTHEFQGPIVAIRGAVQLMQESMREHSWSAKLMFGEDYLSDIWNWSDVLITQVDAANSFRRSKEGLTPSVSKTLLLKEVIAPAIHQVHSLLEEGGYAPERIRYGTFDDIPPLLIDRGQFRQVVFNMLSNAIKYAQDRTTFRVEIESGKIGSDYIIWCSDYGIGISPDLKEAIFEPGFRAPEAALKHVSSQGLGLSVVRAILDAHGGRIQLTGYRKPTRFTIYLPDSLERTAPKGAVLA